MVYLRRKWLKGAESVSSSELKHLTLNGFCYSRGNSWEMNCVCEIPRGE